MDNMLSRELRGSISIVVGGEAGQGIQTIEYLLTKLLKMEGYHIFATKEYMSRIRGGSNSSQIRVSSKRVSAPVDRIDILIPLDQEAIPHLKERILTDTIILGDQARLSSDLPMIDVPYSTIALKIGNILFSSMVAVGVISGLFMISSDLLHSIVRQQFSSKSEDIIGMNLEAVGKGYQIGLDLCQSGRIRIDISNDPKVKEEIFLSGSEAMALGAMAGGCNFISSYPMSPSTGVFTYLAQQSEDFGIIVEQAEDEISAINMGLGAWYAGARAMVSTSGGGFSLMTEGISLAGMIESPMVIHLAQRPGPATGLPTRTEQADLELALHAGHGEFPRILLAPGNLEDAFYLTQRAFNLADKYQIPVIVLTDQHLMDSFYNIRPFDLKGLKAESYFVETENGYQRYKLTEDGISKRGIPGFGKGLVMLDSDEHDEDGRITEDLELRARMVEKRLRKMDLIEREVVSPMLVGEGHFQTLVVGWGSTYHAIREAMEELQRDDAAFLHFRQVYPLSGEVRQYFDGAQDVVIVENNATCQFGRLLKATLGIDIQKRALKYDGLPFSVEELVTFVKNVP
jgi:2-oxoglutarate/2-oxoacid ferredoxin oxidoreductase subunit alpha